MQDPDKLTQTRGSIQQTSFSLMTRMSRIFCPCLSFKQSQSRNNTEYFQSNISNTSNRTTMLQQHIKQSSTHRKHTLQLTPYNLSFKHNDIYYDYEDTQYPVFINVVNNNNNMNNNDKHKLRNSLDIKQNYNNNNKIDLMKSSMNRQLNNSFPIFKYKQNQLIMIGKSKKNMLVLIQTIKLQPSPLSLQKQFLSKSQQSRNKNNKKCKQIQQLCKVIDNFWNIRYYYFQKFDQGIKIDQQSLKYLTPEAVSDYISGKCHQCKVVVDAFSGIGHNATKLGTICSKVICVEDDANKYNYLINNIKCYQIQNIQLCIKPFLQINLKTKVDVVLLHPIILNQVYLQGNACEIKHFKPNLGKVIKKSLEISNNVVLLLPKNISIKGICYEISKQAQQTQKIFCNCTLKIQKIYFKDQLMYIAVFFGPSVQTQIILQGQLEFIYKMLKQTNEKNFQYRKLIKHLRQKYGMIKLLNFVSQSQSISSASTNQSSIQKFIDYIRFKQLIIQQKLISLLSDERFSPYKQKSNTSQFTNSYKNSLSYQKQYQQSPKLYQQSQKQIQQRQQQQQRQRVTQRTQSFISHVSGFSGLQKKKTLTMTGSQKRTIKNNNQSDASSIVIKKITEDSLQKQSKSPASPTNRHITIQRHTFNHEEIINLTKENQKKRLKRTLQKRPEDDDY